MVQTTEKPKRSRTDFEREQVLIAEAHRLASRLAAKLVDVASCTEIEQRIGSEADKLKDDAEGLCSRLLSAAGAMDDDEGRTPFEVLADRELQQALSRIHDDWPAELHAEDYEIKPGPGLGIRILPRGGFQRAKRDLVSLVADAADLQGGCRRLADTGEFHTDALSKVCKAYKASGKAKRLLLEAREVMTPQPTEDGHDDDEATS